LAVREPGREKPRRPQEVGTVAGEGVGGACVPHFGVSETMELIQLPRTACAAINQSAQGG